MPDVPILKVSGIDRRAVAIAAGADRFLTSDEWLMVASVVAEMLLPSEADKKMVSGPRPESPHAR